jgi:type I restriction enzyme M protein
MLPMTVLRRPDCVLADTKAEVLEQSKKLKAQSPGYVHKMLQKAAGQQFYNTSKYDFEKLKADPDGLAQNLLHSSTASPPKSARSSNTSPSTSKSRSSTRPTASSSSC